MSRHYYAYTCGDDGKTDVIYRFESKELRDRVSQEKGYSIYKWMSQAYMKSVRRSGAKIVEVSE